MTVSVLVIGEDTVAISSDRQVSDDDQIHAHQKLRELWRNGRAVGAVACAGTFAHGEFFKNVLTATVASGKRRPPQQTILAAWKRFLKENPDMKTKHRPVSLIVLFGRGFHLDDDGLVTEITDKWAIGSGEQTARGFMFGRGDAPRHLSAGACVACCQLLSSCGLGVDTFEMERANDRV